MKYQNIAETFTRSSDGRWINRASMSLTDWLNWAGNQGSKVVDVEVTNWSVTRTQATEMLVFISNDLDY